MNTNCNTSLLDQLTSQFFVTYPVKQLNWKVGGQARHEGRPGLLGKCSFLKDFYREIIAGPAIV